MLGPGSLLLLLVAGRPRSELVVIQLLELCLIIMIMNAVRNVGDSLPEKLDIETLKIFYLVTRIFLVRTPLFTFTLTT